MFQSRQLAAIMFTDIVGYTAIMDKDEEFAFSLLDKNRFIHKSYIGLYHGKFLKEMGDGILASFTSASDAVYCAGAIQNACENEPDLKLRIGIHQGEVVSQSDDVFGSGVNIASRIEAITPASSIWVSDSVQRNIYNKKALEIKFVKETTLTGVTQAVRIFNIKINSEYTFPPISNQLLNISESKNVIDKSIAVLPFLNMSSDTDQDYFCDGITEEIINTLTLNGGIHVIARTSVFALKNKCIDVSEIARKLNVEFILEGSVRKAGSKIRLYTKLIQANSGEYIWSENFDRDLADIFSIQEEIARSITEQLKILIREKHVVPPTQNMEAFNYYLQGRHIEHKGETGWEEKSIEFYKKAIEKDPRYATAHATIALTSYILGIESHENYSDQIYRYANLALQADNGNAEAHAAIALIKYYKEWNWKEAETGFITALKLSPHSVLTLYHYSTLLSNLTRSEESLALLKLAIKIDPLNTVINQALGWCYFTLGEYELSKSQSQDTLQIEPTNVLAKIVLCFAMIELHEFSDAEAVLSTLPDDNSFAQTCKVWVYTSSNQIDKAEKIINELSTKGNQIPSLMAWMKIAMHEHNEAFEWLNKALERRDVMIMSLPVFKWWDPIRSDQRFKEVLDKTGLTEYLNTYTPLSQQLYIVTSAS